MMKSRDGSLQLDENDIVSDQERYQRITGKQSPLDLQMTLDHQSERMVSDDLDDHDFVTSTDKYATERLGESLKDLEANAEQAAKLSDN